MGTANAFRSGCAAAAALACLAAGPSAWGIERALKGPAWTLPDLSGMRDPFEFRAKATERATPPGRIPPIVPREGVGGVTPEGSAEAGTEEPGNGGEVEAGPRLDQLREAEMMLRRGEQALSLRQFDLAKESAEDGRHRLESANMQESSLAEKLARLRDTAERLRRRAEVEREFQGLGIEVSGIVWEPDKATAFVNGEPKEAGESITNVRIEEIRRNAVIFMYKGLRIRKDF